MQEELKLFGEIPYKTRVLRATPLLASHAQEAIEDILNDTSIFLEMPKLSDILGVRCESVYGVDKLIITLREGVAHPEYMLNARVAQLEPKLINVLFESGEFLQEQMQESAQTQSPQRQTQQTSGATQKTDSTSRPKDISLLTLTCSKLELSYPELAALIGYEAQDLINALSLGEIPKPMKKAIELYLENLELKKELEESSKIKSILKEWVG